MNMLIMTNVTLLKIISELQVLERIGMAYIVKWYYTEQMTKYDYAICPSVLTRV